MNNPTRSERIAALTASYQKMFEQRGGIIPSEPLEFHLFHLARYWSRLLGFCRHTPSGCASFIDGNFGVCVQIGSEFTNQEIAPDSPVYSEWQKYWTQVQALLHDRAPTIEAVEATSQAFDACLAKLKYDPWAHHP